MFRVGQKVVCVDSRFRKEWCPAGINFSTKMHGLKKDAVYTIRAIIADKFRAGSFLLYLEEINRPLDLDGLEPGYSLRRFRPVVERKTDISIFTEMLTPARREHALCENE